MTARTRESRLDLAVPERLLEQLKGGLHDAELALRAPGPTGTAPHFATFLRFINCEAPDEKAIWFECLKVFVEKKAPIAQSGLIADFLVTGDWEMRPELSRNATRMYVEAQLLSFDAPIPGTLGSDGEDILAVDGLLPVAAAIVHDRHEMLDEMLLAGAPLDVGVVQQGGPRREAFELAQTVGARKCLSVLAEHAMRRSISSVDSATTSVSPRRRIGV